MNTTDTNTTDTTSATATVPARWILDASHSSVSFSVRHMMITNVRGEFGEVEGEVLFDPTDLERSHVRASIAVSSIDTREPKRDEHLKSPDFFDAAQHPKITFASRSIRRVKGGYEITGELTIRGTSREVVLAVEDVSGEATDPYGLRRMGASARTTIRRSDFGITWNAALEAGGVLVGDEVKIALDVSLVKQA